MAEVVSSNLKLLENVIEQDAFAPGYYWASATLRVILILSLEKRYSFLLSQAVRRANIPATLVSRIVNLSFPRLKAFVLITIATTLCGCHLLKTPKWALQKEVEKSPLSSPRLAEDSVVIEVSFIRVATENREAIEKAWNDIDETHIPAELRTKLTENGFRYGKLPSAIPSSFEQLLTDDKNTTDPTAQAGNLNLNLGLRNRRLQCSAGSENHIVLSDSVVNDMVVIHSEDQYTSAERFQQAQCQFEFRTYPQPNGSVRLEVVPQIHHGAAKSHFHGHDGAWLLRTQREIEEYTDLLVDTNLQPGESLLLSCTELAPGLGGHFFSDNDDQTEVQHMLRLRVLHTQYDDLFQNPSGDSP